MRHILKDFYHKDIDQIRPSIEDKYVFDINTLLQDARRAGFSDADCISLPQGNGLARQRLLDNLRGALRDELGEIRHHMAILDAFSSTFGIDESTLPIAPMAYFVFRK